ncbi:MULTISPECIES: DUF4139 domain-containing protein [unclassified Streptomyces]|uniref:DUF4139 domain-containing protein n=1 Tax=unclassified Streptomyces TaxID=2593676 RepID=UPI00093B21C2|nr:DUF4139 domain-containing protein [Streptomyces sp. TSRI0107]OKJ74579.1 hypothetical protein AMK31_30790 [Streptomyces sp. TSRI0107]
MTAETFPRWASALDSVVVYAQGALCRRLARGGVPLDGRVRVTGLPRSMDPGSLRARVVGSSGVRVTEARVEVEAEPAGSRPTGELRREVERLRDACQAVRARRDRQRGLIQEVAAVRPVPPPRGEEDPHRPTPVDAWLELADFVDDRLAVLHSRLRELDEELKGVEHELEIAADRLSRASTDAPAAHVETALCALVTLAGAGGTDAEVEVEVEYGVPGALWVPAYRLNHRQGESAGRLLMRAAIAQRTGEDWSGVRVSLATADLRRRTDAPRLRSIRIGRSQPAPAPSGWREPAPGLTDLFAAYDAAGPRPEADGTSLRGAGTETVVAGSPPGPVPPPPPPPPVPSPLAGYGAPPAVLPAPGGAVASPAPAVSGGPPVEYRQPRAFMPESASRTGALPVAAPAMTPAAPGAAAPPVPPPVSFAGPPQPGPDELDYAALVLSGPDAREDRRGRLFPGTSYDPVTAEHRRRAEQVAALPLPGSAVRPRESAGSFDHRYDAAARADIPSDGSWHTISVGEVPVGLRTEYLCVPSVEQAVYTTLVLSNTTEQALPAGPLEVASDGDFLLTTSLPTLAPGGVCRVGLGPDEAIKVTRRTSLHESTSGLRNNVTVLDHRVHVELANRLTVPVTVEVRERVPVTSEAEVRIEERADWKVPSDGAEAERHAPGTRVWRIELPARATAALDGGYVIRIPAGKALTGGNRRS